MMFQLGCLSDSGAFESMPKTKPVRRRTRENKDPREELLAAAIDLFARYGYDPVSTGQIAAAAGLTQSMVHYHFGRKSKLWKAAIQRLMHERGLVFPIGRLDLQDLDPLARLKVIIRKFLSANAADPNLNRILMHEGMARSARLRWLVRHYMLEGYRLFDSAIQEAMDGGAIRRLPVEEVTNIIVSACTMTPSLNILMQEVYGIDITTDEFVSSFGNSIIEVLFKGLELKKNRATGANQKI
jgi:TetR/AcrR family transcriptional regulator